MTGTIVNLVTAKKFGFILGDNNQEYFFHMSEVVDDWDSVESHFAKYGRNVVKVTFEPVKTPKGPRAKEVMLFKDRE